MTDDEDGKGWCSAVDALHHAMDVAVKKCHERYCVIINDPRIFLASFSFVYARETLIRLTAGPSPASQLGPHPPHSWARASSDALISSSLRSLLCSVSLALSRA